MRNELTELEQCVLGVIWRDGPMTAYQIAALFSSSLSPYWSGSAGAIYPVVARLRRRGLVKAAPRAWNGKRRMLLSASERGREVLREWIAPPLPPEAGAPSYDPVRTRLFFIDVLPPDQRAEVIDEAERVVRERLADVQKQRREDLASGNTSEALGGLGAIYELQARLRWLRVVREQITQRD